MSAADEDLREILDRVFDECHRPDLIDPDPLAVVRRYPDPRDREIVALFCASFALGRARAIVDACGRALAPFGPHPADTLSGATSASVFRALDGFVYRFFGARDAGSLLLGSVSLARRFGSLEAAFVAPSDGPDSQGPSLYLLPPTAQFARQLCRCDVFVDRVRAAASDASGGLPLARNLLPAPRDGSACKRLMLFLRWMVRADAVDPGGWTEVVPSELVLPLDVHLHRISRHLGLTTRKAADLRAALEATLALRRFDTDDPVRFDFALARLGIRSDYSLKKLDRP